MKLVSMETGGGWIAERALSYYHPPLAGATRLQRALGVGRGGRYRQVQPAGVCWAEKKVRQQKEVSYGLDWYQQTRDAMNTKRSAREEMGMCFISCLVSLGVCLCVGCVSLVSSCEIVEIRREANRRANNGRDREDLYTDNWDGDVYKGNKVNVLSVLVAISVLAPLVGIIFALQTYGTLWG